MSNKSNEEYKFENEPGSMKEDYAESSHRSSTESIMTVLRNPKIMLPIGVFALFYFGSSYFKEEPKKAPEVVVDTPKPVKVEPIVEAPKPFIPPQVDHSRQMKDSIGSLEGVIDSHQNDIDALKTSVGQLNYQVNGVNQEMQRMSSQLSLILSKMETPKVVEKKKVKKVSKKELYFIKAMVHGRAWIRDLQNKTHTVAVNDSLPVYGKITGIYPDEGFISTESGNVIKFSKYAN